VPAAIPRLALPQFTLALVIRSALAILTVGRGALVDFGATFVPVRCAARRGSWDRSIGHISLMLRGSLLMRCLVLLGSVLLFRS
jgi:hypothetical protein